MEGNANPSSPAWKNWLMTTNQNSIKARLFVVMMMFGYYFYRNLIARATKLSPQNIEWCWVQKYLQPVAIVCTLALASNNFLQVEAAVVGRALLLFTVSVRIVSMHAVRDSQSVNRIDWMMLTLYFAISTGTGDNRIRR